jgi:hypothetical protein
VCHDIPRVGWAKTQIACRSTISEENLRPIYHPSFCMNDARRLGMGVDVDMDMNMNMGAD